MPSTAVPLGLRLLGALQLAQGAWMALAPGSFFDRIGPFGVENAHDVRDASTWSLALGAVSLLAAGRRTWWAPVLIFAALQNGLHAVNHLVDVGKADPRWVGPFDLVALAAVAAALALLARRMEPAR